MRISTIVYELRQGFKNIGRNWMFSIASVVTMAACIFLFGVFFAMVTNINYIVQTVEENVAVTVFFDEGTDEVTMQQIGDLIAERDEVADITFVSAEEAWEDYVDTYFADDPEAADGFKDDNPLANSANFEIKVNNIEDQDELVAYIEGLDHVRKVNESETAVNTLTGFNRLVSYISVAVIIILLIVAIFLISITVSNGISVRKEEISIMKLIGATNPFVSAPFLLEGIILGLIGAVIPLVILYLAYSNVISYIMERFQILTNVMNFLPVNNVFAFLLPVSLILGMGIGFVGSFITTRRHLHV